MGKPEGISRSLSFFQRGSFLGDGLPKLKLMHEIVGKPLEVSILAPNDIDEKHGYNASTTYLMDHHLSACTFNANHGKMAKLTMGSIFHHHSEAADGLGARHEEKIKQKILFKRDQKK